MTFATFIGLAAACLTTVAFAPQVLKAWRSRSTRDLSLGMYLVLASGIVLWLVYGLMIGDLPLILANAVTLLLVSIIL
ncbi:MAG: SemiSWEET transporter [Alphaproteobacteria bacterium]